MKQNYFNERKAYRFKRFTRAAYSAFNSMHKEVSIGVLTGCVLFCASTLAISAQPQQVSIKEEKIEEQELDEVTVTASRAELPMNQTARLVTVISKQEIEQAPIYSIQDLLNYTANVDVLQRGGHGVQADISIRGGSFDQTAILLNGINLSSPHTGHYSFDIPINLSDIERIEIIHGPSSMIYGASAFSGGINIITNKKPDYKAYVKAEAGGHNLWGAEAKGVLGNKHITSQLSAGYSRSDGYTKNSDYNILNVLWQTHLNVEQSVVDIQMGYSDKQYGANTFYSAAYPNQYDAISTYFASISGKTGKKLKFIPKLYWTRRDDQFELVKNKPETVPYNYHQGDVYGLNLNFEYSSILGITSVGSELRSENILSSNLGKEQLEPKGKYKKSDDRTNVSYMLEHNILIDDFTLSLGLLANYNTALKKDFKYYPAINTSYRLIDKLKIYASWNKAMRMPTFTDLYYNTPTHKGSDNLKHEESEAIEVGFKYNSNFIKATISAYYMEGRNLIDWIKEDPKDKWQSINFAKVYKKGIEIETSVFLHEILPVIPSSTFLKLGYTRIDQDSKDTSGEVNSNYLLNYLRDKFTTTFNVPIYKGLSINGNFRWQNRMGSFIKPKDKDDDIKTPYSSFSTMDIRLNWLYKDLLINLSVNNIYNTRFYDLGNIPQAGFWMSGGISYTFR